MFETLNKIKTKDRGIEESRTTTDRNLHSTNIATKYFYKLEISCNKFGNLSKDVK